MASKSKMCLEHLPAFMAWLRNQPEYFVLVDKPYELFRVFLPRDLTPRIFFQEKSSIVGYGDSIAQLMARYLRDSGSALVNGKEKHYGQL